MNARVEAVNVRFDTLKIAAAVLIVLAALAGFYAFAQYSVLLRTVGLIAAIVVAVLIALQTEQGRVAASYLRETQVEVRKVVWPTREETVQTTGIVILVVLVFAAILFVLDYFLGWAVRGIIGQ
jgi:preprotein translocase subunit SecE